MKMIYSIGLLVAALMLTFDGPVMASQLDERIESAAKESYVFKTYLKDEDVRIESQDGVVALTGSVSEEAHKSLAQETVKALPGVRKVENKLEIKGEDSAENPDLWLMTKVKTTLLFHRSVSGLKTKVDVKDGIVTLRGNADSEAQKDLVSEYVKDIEGVKEVKNEMSVAKTPTMADKIDDASITAQVKMALLFHRSTSAINTSVTTENGVVLLSGQASNEAEKELVTEIVADIQGVQSVVNNMTVEKTKTPKKRPAIEGC
ncbi:MAG: BON domain-containing protein [Deltaproteobacteria bacterium]|jgi:hyperosmotically inducible protein|nr:BON domain-containing protein [Deltaproteobacteria bacterium]